ncbi:MAG: TetR/AcrR family transcriptional regulator [Balneolaceae bacterium]|nr:TetR/AcrR family transcriptional regulator [Balneolaceae bacterium]
MKGNSRDYIIRKTAQLFNKLGPRGTSLTDITRETGMTKGAIYANFENKDALAAEVFNYNVNRLFEKERDLLRLKESPHEQLMILLDFYQHAFKYKEFEYGCPVANMAPEADDTSEVLLKAVRNALDKATGYYRRLIEQAIEEQEYVGEADPDFAFTMTSVIEGGLLIAKASGQQEYLGGACNILRQQLLDWRNGDD